MKSIAFYNNKGGSGKTTLSFNAACYFAEHGLKVVAVCLDPQRDLLKYFAGPDGMLLKDEVIELRNIVAAYSPNKLPEGVDCDVLIADCPPDIAISRKVRPTRWVSPVDNNFSLDNLAGVLRDLRLSAPVTAVMNKAGAGGKWAAEELSHALSTMRDIDIHKEEICQSRVIARAMAEHRPVWETRFSKRAEGTKQIERFCAYLMRVCGLKPGARQKWPEWKR